jgi:hypothetical protein
LKEMLISEQLQMPQHNKTTTYCFPLWHLKDLDAERKTVLPVAKGTINYETLCQSASTAG